MEGQLLAACPKMAGIRQPREPSAVSRQLQPSITCEWLVTLTSPDIVRKEEDNIPFQPTLYQFILYVGKLEHMLYQNRLTASFRLSHVFALRLPLIVIELRSCPGQFTQVNCALSSALFLLYLIPHRIQRQLFILLVIQFFNCSYSNVYPLIT